MLFFQMLIVTPISYRFSLFALLLFDKKRSLPVRPIQFIRSHLFVNHALAFRLFSTFIRNLSRSVSCQVCSVFTLSRSNLAHLIRILFRSALRSSLSSIQEINFCPPFLSAIFFIITFILQMVKLQDKILSNKSDFKFQYVQQILNLPNKSILPFSQVFSV